MPATAAIEATYPAPVDYAANGTWPDRTLGSHLAEMARRSPAALAVVDGSTRLTYGELEGLVSRTAGAFRRLGVGHHDVVTVQLPNWWETLVVVHAALRVGAVVNPVVPIYREHELGFILGQARPRLAVVAHRFRGFDYAAMTSRLVATVDDPPVVVVVRPEGGEGGLPGGVLSFDELLDITASEAGPAPDGADPDDICLLLYTSGTTAAPKGVLHSHRTLGYENRSMIELFDFGPDDTVFMASPLTHITGFLYGVLLPPMLGAASVLLDIWDPGRAAELVEAEQCRFTMSATPFLQGLVTTYAAAGRPCALRVFLCGGADVPPELVNRAQQVLGASVMRVYGSSEFPTFCCGRPGDGPQIAAETDGLPIGPAELRLADPDASGVGELLVRGPDLFLGYLDPALNADAFAADGFFLTGDLAAVGTDGAVTIMGRKKDIIIRNGENISAREVENLLYEHPAVREAAVVAVPDPVTGEKAFAVVVPEPGQAPTLSELCLFLTERRLARQKLPEQLELVEVLPTTTTGKIQKFLLRERLRSLTPRPYSHTIGK